MGLSYKFILLGIQPCLCFSAYIFLISSPYVYLKKKPAIYNLLWVIVEIGLIFNGL